MARKKGEKLSGRIIVSNGYEILVDSNSYNLVYNTGKKSKDGDAVYSYISYHGSLEQAINACKREFVRKGIIEKNTMALEDAVTIVVRSNNRFEALLNNCFKGLET